MNIKTQFNIKQTIAAIGIVTLTSVAYSAEFTDLDVDVDGRLTQDEMQAYEGVVQNWTDVDADGDGMIDETEFAAFVQDSTLTEKTGWESAGGSPGAAKPALEADIGDEFDKLDMDRDGNLSQAEMQAHSGVIEYWGDVDANRDDYIDRDEFTTMSSDASLSERTGWQNSTSTGPGPATPAQN
jgi:Ca2+-binding EF-hand superfamily protein